jgi:hypothetical protein
MVPVCADATPVASAQTEPVAIAVKDFIETSGVKLSGRNSRRK